MASHPQNMPGLNISAGHNTHWAKNQVAGSVEGLQNPARFTLKITGILFDFQFNP